MKQLTTYINEKLVLSKDTFKKSYNYFPKTKKELQDILDQLLYKLLKERKINNMIDLNDIDTSEITDMSNLFSKLNLDYKIYKIDISNWNVSNVEDMNGMFLSCYDLESIGDLSSWNVSKVTNMYYMFRNCIELKSIGNLSLWDVSKVQNMWGMFSFCENLKSVGNLNKWNIEKLENMKGMFDNSGIKNKPKWYKNESIK